MTCTWTDWINLGKPTPGPDGGDDESIQNIIAAGYHICSAPDDVQCRAVLYPGIPISKLGQAVTCSKDVGLICNNKQQGLAQECFDYEIKVKCCSCPTSTTSAPTTPSTTSTTHPPSSTTTSTSATPTTTVTTTTTQPPTSTTAPSTTSEATTNIPIFTSLPSTSSSSITPSRPSATTSYTTGCFCHHNGSNYLPGEIVYNVTDHDGHCYFGLCDQYCHVVPRHDSCHPKGAPCLNVTPPRQDGETWNTSNCQVGKCDDGKVTYNKTQCPDPKSIVCANNLPPIEVWDDNECCPHYECQCVCYGWGDPHYVTFDGTYYSFQGNCSYWLVKEISPKYNFSVMIDNYYCDAAEHLSCPQSITVFYNKFKIFMTQTNINGIFINEVSVNDKPVSPAYQNNDFRIITTGIETVLVIPKIHAKVTFSGITFSIYLPYSQFGENTQGQCGTCNNNRTNDCLLPSGKIDPSCPHMAHEWHTNNSYCGPPVLPTPTPTPTTCVTTICEIITSSVFEACHKIIDPTPFVKACEFDVCHMHINHIDCSSLQTYAEACAEAGVCIDWRSSTNGLCEYKCSNPKVYKPCGPDVEPTCDSWYNKKFIFAVNEFSAMTNKPMEGCYCPDNTTLLSVLSDECVPTCEICRLPNGKWKMANEIWIDGCEECICEEHTLDVVCRHVSCPTQPTLECHEEGQVKVNHTVSCCTEQKCECDKKKCPTVPSCPVGHDAVNITMGSCCLIYKCELKQQVCVYNNSTYKVGELVPMNPCDKCICSNETEAKGEHNAIDCKPIPCDTHCPVGHEYETTPGHCCGKCVQKSCIVTLHNSTHTLKPGTTWNPAEEPCVKFECVKNHNQFITVETKTTCPSYKPEECIPGTEVISPDGCCRTCTTTTNNPCNVSTSAVRLENKGCFSKDLVNLTSCSGACGTFTFYSTKMKSLQHTCSCCQEMATSERQVQLFCPDDTEITYTYIHIDSCGCLKTECSVPGHSNMATSGIKSRRRRR